MGSLVKSQTHRSDTKVVPIEGQALCCKLWVTQDCLVAQLDGYESIHASLCNVQLGLCHGLLRRANKTAASQHKMQQVSPDASHSFSTSMSDMWPWHKQAQVCQVIRFELCGCPQLQEAGAPTLPVCNLR